MIKSNLKRYLHEQGLYYSHVANILGIGDHAVVMKINGYRKFSEEDIRKIAFWLELDDTEIAEYFHLRGHYR